MGRVQGVDADRPLTGAPHLRVEMRTSPIAWPTESAALADRIRRRLGHAAEITICEPGTLGALPNY